MTRQKQNDSGFFQINTLTSAQRKAIRVGAALLGVTMQEWIIIAIKNQSKHQGIVVEEGD